MRYAIALLVLIGVTVGGFLVYRELTAPLPVVLPVPSTLQVSAGGTSLLKDGWTNSASLTVSARVPTDVSTGMDVEVRPQQERFTGSPTASTQGRAPVTVACAPNTKCPGPVDPSVSLHLGDGGYHVQVRLHNDHGISPWKAYRGAISIDTIPPPAPQITSSTDPNPATVYHSSSVKFAWQTSDSGSGLSGYSYRLDTDPHGQAKTEIRTADAAVTLAGLNTGTFYFHVRALDHAGNWGPNSTFPVRIDVTPPGLAQVRFNEYQFDPQYDPLQVSFVVTRPVTTVHIGVYRQSDRSLVRLYTVRDLLKGQSASVSWDGKDSVGRVAPAGTYMIYIRPTDQYGHSSLSGWRDFVVNYQRIVISLSQQKLVAYDGNSVFLTSLVTTGNRELPTPTGTFHILGKFHPFTFRSPWPKSSPYYYAPSKTEYAMLFREGGYFIHDAPWRSVFGPGSNLQAGKPGSNYTGTHGCVNVPADVAFRLFEWDQIGTVVEITP